MRVAGREGAEDLPTDDGCFHAQAVQLAGVFAAGFFEIVNGARDRAAFRAIEHGGFFGDDALFEGLDGGEVESAPAEGLAGFDDFVKAFALAFALHDGFLGAEIGAHDFEQGIAAAADFGNEPLADDPAERVRQGAGGFAPVPRFQTCRGYG